MKASFLDELQADFTQKALAFSGLHDVVRERRLHRAALEDLQKTWRERERVFLVVVIELSAPRITQQELGRSS